MCEYCENGKNIELATDSAKSYWFIIKRNGIARLYCKMGESQLGNCYGIEIRNCPMCGRKLTETEDEAMYQAIYKCRLCGEEFYHCEEYELSAQAKIMGLVLTNNPRSGFCINPIHKNLMHKCKEGSFGFADFQGFKKVEE